MALSTLRRLKYVYFSPTLDNFIYQLCYRWTVLLLVIFSFVITCRLVLGNSFACYTAENLTYYAIATVSCYSNGTYILPAELVKVKDKARIADPSAEKLRRYQDYYPWVNLLFLVQAFVFYLPHLLWKSYESGYLRRLTVGVQAYFDRDERRGLELCYLAKYVLITQGKHRFFATTYFILESCNYSISVVQALWLVWFFNVTGMPKGLPLKLESWSDFRNFYFPLVGMCNIPASGYTSEISGELSTCQLPLNSLHMKMFLFLFAWYVFLAVLCGLVIVYRIMLLVPSFRAFVIRSSSSLAERSVLDSMCHRLSYSDWFFLSKLRKAMTDVDFAQMIDKIAILSQGREEDEEERKDQQKRVSFLDDIMKDFDSSNDTTPV